MIVPVPQPAPSSPRADGVARTLRQLRRDPLAIAAALTLLIVVAASLLAPILPLPSYTQAALGLRLKPPGTPGHILGTDALGRDELARLVWGARTTLRIAFIVVAASSLVGTVLGLIAGYKGGWLDELIMRLVDIMVSLPGTLIALMFVLVLGAKESTVILALAINGWMVHARMARGLVFSAKQQPYLEVARVAGASPMRLVLIHILPNILPTLATLLVLEIARIVQVEVVLSFLGYGVQSPNSSLGLMVADGRRYLPTHPYLVTVPGVAIAVTLLAFNQLVNWLRVSMDPLQRLRSNQ